MTSSLSITSPLLLLHCYSFPSNHSPSHSYLLYLVLHSCHKAIQSYCHFHLSANCVLVNWRPGSLFRWIFDSIKGFCSRLQNDNVVIRRFCICFWINFLKLLVKQLLFIAGFTFVYELSFGGFESRCSHCILKSKVT